MTLVGATLTLPGIAGIVLGIGLAVDANVLINERIREEVGKGRGAFAAIDHGFARPIPRSSIAMSRPSLRQSCSSGSVRVPCVALPSPWASALPFPCSRPFRSCVSLWSPSPRRYKLKTITIKRSCPSS